jgi:hypothetical protein
MTDRKKARGLTLLFSSVALLAMAGCGGGSGSLTASASPDTLAPTHSAESAGSAPAPAPAAGDATAPAPAPAAATSPAPAPAPATAPAPAPAPVASSAPKLGDCEMFPSAAIFNTRIDDTSRFPAHPDSDGWISRVGYGVRFQADWGITVDQADYSTYWGMPINVVGGTDTQWPVVSFDFASSGVSMESGYPQKSDCAAADGSGFGISRCSDLQTSQRRFPFPVASKLVSEDGHCNDPNTCGDRHVLVVEQGACRLWESYFAYNLSGQWYAMTTAAWDLKSLALRPKDWPSGDAAGLPMAPLLVKEAEASSGEIKHALRVNFREAAIALAYDWPARHAAGGDNPGAMPFGALLRLKADFVIPSDWTPQARAVATAAKRYGMYVSDNGADFHVQGEPSAAWDTRTMAQLKTITMGQMEFVDLKAITSDPRFSPDSMAASW